MDRQQPNPPVDLIISREPEFPGQVVWQQGRTLGIAPDEATAAQRRAEDDARALLAQAEPEVRGPSDEELLRLAREWNSGYESIEFEFITDFARAVLARYGRPTPAPAGEAGELVAWLTEQAVRAADCKQPMAAGMLTWAAQVVGEHTELLGRCHAASVAVLPDEAQVIEPTERTILVPVPAPVLVSERLPEPGVKVLAHYLNDMGKGRTICAIWVPAKYCSDDTDFADYDFTEYNDEDDKFYWPEGWYEAIENWDDFGWVKVNEGDVIYWQPLPKWPTTALPLPNGKVES